MEVRRQKYVSGDTRPRTSAIPAPEPGCPLADRVRFEVTELLEVPLVGLHIESLTIQLWCGEPGEDWRKRGDYARAADLGR